MPEVSVIVPTCDRPSLVRRALVSILRQDFGDFELLLVDANRHTPPVAQNPLLTDLLADPRLRLIDARHTANAAMSRNVGLRAAQGRWITFLDDDDEYLPGKISAQHRLATATGSPLVLCGYEFVWPRRRRRRQVDRGVFRGDEILTLAAYNTPLLFHRSDATIRFDEHLSTGHDLTYALEFILRHGLHELPSVPTPLVAVYPQADGRNVHADGAAAWRAWRAAWRLARHRFSPAAGRALLAYGRLERATKGYGSRSHFFRCVGDVIRTRGLREYRLIAYSLLTRFRR